MTKAEFGVFTAALKTYYPREKDLLPNDAAMQLWYKQLCDIPFPVAEAALDKWVALNKWPPSIAEFREVSATVVHVEAADWGEAWGAVLDRLFLKSTQKPNKTLYFSNIYTNGELNELTAPAATGAVMRTAKRSVY